MLSPCQGTFLIFHKTHRRSSFRFSILLTPWQETFADAEDGDGRGGDQTIWYYCWMILGSFWIILGPRQSLIWTKVFKNICLEFQQMFSNSFKTFPEPYFLTYSNIQKCSLDLIQTSKTTVYNAKHTKHTKLFWSFFFFLFKNTYFSKSVSSLTSACSAYFDGPPLAGLKF